MIQHTPACTENEQEDPFVTLTVDVMQQLFGFTPRPFQKVVIPHIIKMKNNNCSPVLLVHGTGGGKSSICQTIAIIKGGIALVVQNTLSLPSDQMSKIKFASSKHKNARCIQLDSIVGDKMTATLKLNMFDSIGTMARHCDRHWNGITLN